MKKEKQSLNKNDPGYQLELLSISCNNLSPYIYKEHALYLQILRNKLHTIVKTVICSIISDLNKEEFDSFTASQSKIFQENVDKIVTRCISLLTIEHLIDLSYQVDEEKKARIIQAKQKLETESHKDYLPSNENSVDLSFQLPIENKSFLNDWQIRTEITDLNNSYEIELGNDKPYGAFEINEYKNTSKNPGEILEENQTSQSKSGLDLIKSIFLLAGESINPVKNLKEKDLDNQSLKHNKNTSCDKKLLPDDPISLSNWIDSLEFALSLRLRNLSHALNLELLKIGAVNTLLPIGFLDAVLGGHIETQFSIPNLLRLSVPVQNSGMEEIIDISCILLRASELEFDDPKLRICRSRLTKYRSNLIRMSKQQRYWQSRYVEKEVHQKWWQTPQEIKNK